MIFCAKKYSNYRLYVISSRQNLISDLSRVKINQLIKTNSKSVHFEHFINISVQECFPVGCVPSAAVAVYWGGGEMGCLPTGGVCLQGLSAQGGVCLEGCLPRWGCRPVGCRPVGVHSPPLARGQNSWQTLVKTLLSATSLANGKYSLLRSFALT